tara:strand:- start:171 stop:491 length:321 start_codon:yes stop_codon:yes gene_type:complete
MKKISDTLKELGVIFSFPIKIMDANGNVTYCEDSDGFWYKSEYDTNGNETYYEDSNGDWLKREYGSDGKETYSEDSYGVKFGTPRSQSCDGKVIEVDGTKYKLTAL